MSSKNKRSAARMKIWFLLIVALALVIGQALPAAAVEGGNEPVAVTLVPSDDSFIENQDDERQVKINGTGTSLQIANDEHANPRRIYLKFDFSSVDLTEMKSAVLRLYNNDTRYRRIVTAYKTEGNDTSWTEGTLNWNNAPAPGAVILKNDQIEASVEIANLGNNEDRLLGADYYEMDVTSYFNEVSVAGEISIILLSNGYTSFASKEYRAGAYPPQLILSSEEPEVPVEAVHKWLEEDGRSSLYPEAWYPGYGDDEGRFLHDFSYAGYHMGEDSIPDTIPGGLQLDVTREPYFADNTGSSDATEAIQAAIDDAGSAGGGIVYLPAGTYKVKPHGANNQALKLNKSGVVLRGAGPDETFIYNDESVMRGKDIITVTSDGDGFLAVSGTESLIRTDLPEPTVTIPVQDVSAFKTGDWITISNKYTDEFIAEHDMTDWWGTYVGNEGITFYRKVIAVDSETNTITIDIPTRYPLKVRDSSGVYKLNPPVTEVGVEHLSIGNVQNLTPGIEESDNTKEGTAGFEVAGTNVINFVRVVDGWARNVHSYRPPTNDPAYNYHILSSGIHTANSRNVTIVDCVMEKPLFRGAGGNGYLFELVGNDNLILNSKAVEGRHNFTFSHMRTSGNVIRDSVSIHPSHVIDFHQYLSASNLLDGIQLYGDTIEASVRPYPSSSQTYKHGQTTSQTVIWNTYGDSAHSKDSTGAIIDSRQYGYGYVIGTKGGAAEVRVTPELHSGKNTSPIDFTEGIGQGDLLLPQSLSADQLQKRISRKTVDLQTIKVNGRPLTDFQFGKLEYDIELPYGTVTVPAISAVAADAGSSVEVTNAAALPGATIIQVTSQELKTATYTLRLKAAETPAVLSQIALLPDRTKPGWKSGVKLDNGHTAYLRVTGLMSDGKEADLSSAAVEFVSDHPEILTVDGSGQVITKTAGTANVTVTVTLGGIELSRTIAVTSSVPVQTDLESLPIVALSSSGDDGNIVENIMDGDYDTRWSASGEGQWFIADLGAIRKVGSASLAFYNGHTRKSVFDIDVSVDGENWTTLYAKIEGGNSSGESTLFELFTFPEPHDARYVRYMGYGNSINPWNSLTEIRIHPPESTPPTTPTPTTPPIRGGDSNAETVEALFNGSADTVLISTDIAVIEAPGNMFDKDEIGENGKITFVIRINHSDEIAGLAEAGKEAIGSRPIIHIQAYAGNTEIRWNNPDSPVTVKVPYSPTEEERTNPGKLEKLTVWYIDDQGETQAIPNAAFDEETGMIVFRTTHFSSFAVALQEESFQDLSGYPWARHEIEVLASKGVINGMSENTYSPSMNIRRADFTMLLIQALGLSASAETSFSDVAAEVYYSDEVAIAEKLGIVNGVGDGRFNPSAEVTREEMMVIIARALKAAGKLEPSSDSALGQFADTGDVSDYAADSIAVLVESGIVTGDGGQLKPRDKATRAETAVLIYRMLKK